MESSAQFSSDVEALRNVFFGPELDEVIEKNSQVRNEYLKIKVKNDVLVMQRNCLMKAIYEMEKELAEATKKKNVAMDLQEKIDEAKETGILIQSQVDFVTEENKKKTENCIKIMNESEDFAKQYPWEAEVKKRWKEASRKESNGIYRIVDLPSYAEYHS